MKDPRAFITTENLHCELYHPGSLPEWSVGGMRKDRTTCGYADWPEVVELAQKILAANEAWLDANTPTLDELQARYPEWEPCVLYVRTGWRVWAERLRAPGHPIGQDNFPTKEAAIRWLAAALAEITPVEGGWR